MIALGGLACGYKLLLAFSLSLFSLLCMSSAMASSSFLPSLLRPSSSRALERQVGSLLLSTASCSRGINASSPASFSSFAFSASPHSSKIKTPQTSFSRPQRFFSTTSTTKPTTNSLTMASQPFLDALKDRRSIYALTKESTISDARIQQLIHEIVLHVPSSFNSQSTRVVLLLKEEHDKFWEIAKGVVKAVAAEDAWPATEKKLNGFKGAYGTVGDVLDDSSQIFSRAVCRLLCCTLPPSSIAQFSPFLFSSFPPPSLCSFTYESADPPTPSGPLLRIPLRHRQPRAKIPLLRLSLRDLGRPDLRHAPVRAVDGVRGRGPGRQSAALQPARG